MTTQVIIDAHAGWDIEVELVMAPLTEGAQEVRKVEIVEKHTIKNLYIHSGMYIGYVKEIKQE